MEWFSHLSPEAQFAVGVQIAGVIFNAGFYYANIRFLRQEVKEVKEVQKEHAGKLETHGEEIAALKVARG